MCYLITPSAIWPEVLLPAKTYGSLLYDKLSPLDSSGEVVGPVRNDVTMEEWGNMSQVFIGNVGTRLAERLDDSGNLERVPYQDGVGYQAQALALFMISW